VRTRKPAAQQPLIAGVGCVYQGNAGDFIDLEGVLGGGLSVRTHSNDVQQTKP